MSAPLSRRTFLQSASVVAAAQALAPGLRALAPPSVRVAFAAGENGIHCFQYTGADWRQMKFVECEMPSALALHAPTQTLYVAHGTDTFAHLPTGSVSCYRFGPGQGLTLLHRQALSLACTRPDAIAVAPGGEMLAVASSHAGILNVLPLDRSGIPAPVTAARKELSWRVSAGLGTAPVRLEFLDDATLLAAHAQQATCYRCTHDTIHFQEQKVIEQEGAGRAMHPIAKVIQDAVSGGRHTPVVWL